MEGVTGQEVARGIAARKYESSWLRIICDTTSSSKGKDGLSCIHDCTSIFHSHQPEPNWHNWI
jgi:hypothetical protein